MTWVGVELEKLDATRFSHAAVETTLQEAAKRIAVTRQELLADEIDSHVFTKSRIGECVSIDCADRLSHALGGSLYCGVGLPINERGTQNVTKNVSAVIGQQI